MKSSRRPKGQKSCTTFETQACPAPCLVCGVCAVRCGVKDGEESNLSSSGECRPIRCIGGRGWCDWCGWPVGV